MLNYFKACKESGLVSRLSGLVAATLSLVLQQDVSRAVIPDLCVCVSLSLPRALIMTDDSMTL